MVDVAQQQDVEGDRCSREQCLGVPVGVGERLEGAVAHEGGEVGLLGDRREVVVEVRPAGLRHEVLPVNRGIADDDRFAAQPGREAEVLEEVEPLGVSLRLVVADDGEEGDVGVRETTQCGDDPLDVHESRSAVVEQVARVDDGVGVVRDGVVHHRLERPEEVRPAPRRVVLLVADVCVGSVHDSGHCPAVVAPGLSRFRERGESETDAGTTVSADAARRHSGRPTTSNSCPITRSAPRKPSAVGIFVPVRWPATSPAIAGTGMPASTASYRLTMPN